MKIRELAEKMDLAPLSLPDGDREVEGFYAGDLLSWVMGDGMPGQGADELTEFFEGLEHRLLFRTWYFGHHHVDRIIPPDHRCLYYDIVRLGELEDVEA